MKIVVDDRNSEWITFSSNIANESRVTLFAAPLFPFQRYKKAIILADLMAIACLILAIILRSTWSGSSAFLVALGGFIATVSMLGMRGRRVERVRVIEVRDVGLLVNIHVFLVVIIFLLFIYNLIDIYRIFLTSI